MLAWTVAATAVVRPAVGAGFGSGIKDGADGGEMLGAAAASVVCSLPVLKIGAEFCAVAPKASTTQLEQTTTPSETYSGRRLGDVRWALMRSPHAARVPSRGSFLNRE